MTANAREVTFEAKITGLYVAFFNRAADEGGLTYWTQKGNTAQQNGDTVSNVLKELAAGFAQHPSFTRAYGDMDNQEFVEAVYRNTLGREGDAQGVSYWTGLLNGGMSRSDFVSIFVEAALTFDRNDPQYADLSEEDLNAAQLRQDLISNKVEAALAFTHQLGVLSNVSEEHQNDPENDPAYLASIKIISGVTEENSTVETVLSFLESIENREDSIDIILSTDVYVNRYDIQFLPLNESIYNPGDTIEVRLGWEQNGSGTSCDLYVTLDYPDGKRYFFDANGSLRETPAVKEELNIGQKRRTSYPVLEYPWEAEENISQGTYRLKVWIVDKNATNYDDEAHWISLPMERSFQVTSHYIPMTYGVTDGKVRTFRHLQNDDGFWIVYNRYVYPEGGLFAMKVGYEGRMLIAPFPFSSGRVYYSQQGSEPCTSQFAVFAHKDGFAVVSKEKNYDGSSKPYQLWYRAFDSEGLLSEEVLLADHQSYDEAVHYLWGASMGEGALAIGWSKDQLYLWIIDGHKAKRYPLSGSFDPYEVGGSCKVFYKASYDSELQRLILLYGLSEGQIWFLKVKSDGAIEMKKEISSALDGKIDIKQLAYNKWAGWPEDFHKVGSSYYFMTGAKSVSAAKEAWIFAIDPDGNRVRIIPILGSGNSLMTYGNSKFDTVVDANGIFHWVGRTGSEDYHYARFDINGTLLLSPTSIWHHYNTSDRPFVALTVGGLPYFLFDHYYNEVPCEIELAFFGYDFSMGEPDLGVSAVHIHQQPAPYAAMGQETVLSIDVCNRGEAISGAATLNLEYLDKNYSVEVPGGLKEGNCTQLTAMLKQPDFLMTMPMLKGELLSYDYQTNNDFLREVYFPPLTPIYPAGSQKYHWQVLDADTGAIVPYAYVYYDLNDTMTVSGLRHSVRFELMTNEGEFDTVLPQGSYRFTIYKAGYPRMSFPVMIDPEEPPVQTDFELIPPGSLYFTFMGTDGLSLHPASQRVTITLQHDFDSSLPEWESYNYELEGNATAIKGKVLMPGSYSGIVQAFGYEAKMIHVTVSGGQEQKVDLSLTPLPRGTLSGTILSEGSAVANASVRIIGVGIEGITESEGNFTLEDLPIMPENTYQLEISKNGYRTTLQSFVMDSETKKFASIILPKIYSRYLTIPKCRYAAWVQDAQWNFQNSYEIKTIYGVWDLQGKLHYGQLEGSDTVDLDQLSIKIDAWRWDYWDLDGHVIDSFVDSISGVLADSYQYLKYLLKVKEVKEKVKMPGNLLVTKQELSDPMGTVKGAVVDCGDPDALEGLDEYTISSPSNQTVVRIDDLRIYDMDMLLYSMHESQGWVQYYSDQYSGNWINFPITLSQSLSTLENLTVRLYIRVENGDHNSAPLDLVGSDRLYLEWKYRDGKLQWSGYLSSPSDYPSFEE